MPAQLNHTIVASRDPLASATFLSEILDLPAPVRFGPFHIVATGNGVSLDYAASDGDVASQHYAFLVEEGDFDGILARVRAKGLDIWADPHQHRPGVINEDHGRGFYFFDPDGHYLEVLTRPYEVPTA